ncbi:hypothetical protein GQ53DRAFT_753360 [Thozetella sp. PMI_491]|nr:hypothetical protein GQ53DRAFT_753360 [Thozetella sp. PMI_491]
MGCKLPAPRGGGWPGLIAPASGGSALRLGSVSTANLASAPWFHGKDSRDRSGLLECETHARSPYVEDAYNAILC